MPPPLYSREDIDRAVRAAAQEMGYSKLRENQETVVKTFLQCRDVFVSLPTGSGKSLCYCILPLVFDKIKRKETESIAVVVSPLIALMKDQVMGMTRKRSVELKSGDIGTSLTPLKSTRSRTAYVWK
jgi:superfamily II DNA helicase RecQ